MDRVLIARPHPGLVDQMKPLLSSIFDDCLVCHSWKEMDSHLGGLFRMIVVSTSFFRDPGVISFEETIKLVLQKSLQVPIVVTSIADPDKAEEYIKMVFEKMGAVTIVDRVGSRGGNMAISPGTIRVLSVTRADFRMDGGLESIKAALVKHAGKS